MQHKQVTIETGIEVDERIAPLVLALSKFPNLFTLSSCEADDKKGAYVYFRCRDTVQFVDWLADRLRASLASSCDYKLRLEWLGGSEVIGEVQTRPDYVESLANALLAISACHRSQSSDDREYRELRSLTGRLTRQPQQRFCDETQP